MWWAKAEWELFSGEIICNYRKLCSENISSSCDPVLDINALLRIPFTEAAHLNQVQCTKLEIEGLSKAESEEKYTENITFE